MKKDYNQNKNAWAVEYCPRDYNSSFKTYLLAFYDYKKAKNVYDELKQSRYHKDVKLYEIIMVLKSKY